VTVSAGIWAFGALVFTLLAKSSIAIDLGDVRASEAADTTLTELRPS